MTPRPRTASRSGRGARLVGAALLLSALSACAAAPSPGAQAAAAPDVFSQALHDRLPDDVRERGVLRLATDGTYPPASTFDADGRTIIGFEPDLAAAVGRVLGVEVEFVRHDFDETLPALARGDVDGVMAAMTDTQERQAVADFVDYFSAGTSIVVQRGNPHGITDLRDLCGRTVAAERATTQVDLLERTQGTCGAEPIRITQFPDNASALLELRTGRAAAVLNDYPPAARLTSDARTSVHFQLASTTQYEPGFYGIAVRKDQPALRDVLLEGLQATIETGEYAEVLGRWGVASGAVAQPSVNAGATG